MKNYLVVFFLSLAGISFSQKAETFYQTENGEYAFKLDGETCILYHLSRYDQLVYREWEIYPTHQSGFESQLDSLGIIFSNGQYAISYDYKYFSVCDLKNGKVKKRRTYVAKKMADPTEVYKAINHAYWNVLYQKMISEIQYDFPLFNEFHYHYRQTNWSIAEAKQSIPEQFEVLAKEQIGKLKDSLSKANLKLTALNDSIEKNIQTLTLEELKRNWSERPIHHYAYDEYQQVMLHTIAENRPDLFFDLAQALPEERAYLFGKIYQKEAIKSLKRYETDSSIQKEFRKFRRKQAWRVGLITTGVVTLQTAVIGGAITGIVFWIRK